MSPTSSGVTCRYCVVLRFRSMSRKTRVHLLGSQTRGIGDILDRHAVVLSEQAWVHVGVWPPSL